MMGQVTLHHLGLSRIQDAGIENQFTHHQGTVLVNPVEDHAGVPVAGGTYSDAFSVYPQFITVAVELPADDRVNVGKRGGEDARVVVVPSPEGPAAIIGKTPSGKSEELSVRQADPILSAHHEHRHGHGPGILDGELLAVVEEDHIRTSEGIEVLERGRLEGSDRMSGVAGKIVPRGDSSLFGTGIDRSGEITVSSTMERRNLGCVQLAAKNPEVVDTTVEITPLVRKDSGDPDGKGRVLGRIERTGKFRAVQAEGSVEVDLEAISVGNRKVIPDSIRYPRSRGGMEGILRPGSRIKVDLELGARGANLKVVVEGGPALGNQDVVNSVVGGHPHFVGGAVEPEG